MCSSGHKARIVANRCVCLIIQLPSVVTKCCKGVIFCLMWPKCEVCCGRAPLASAAAADDRALQDGAEWKLLSPELQQLLRDEWLQRARCPPDSPSSRQDEHNRLGHIPGTVTGAGPPQAQSRARLLGSHSRYSHRGRPPVKKVICFYV